MKTLAEIRQVKETQEDKFFEQAGVTGVDVGYKIVNGKPTKELSIRVYVAAKQPEKALSKAELIAKTINGIKTDVIQRTFVPHPLMVRLQDLKIQADATRYDTLHGGISIGPCRAVHLEPPDVEVAGDYLIVGTLGVLVTDRATHDDLLLSNFHVMCVDNTWHVGDDMCQPGRAYDGGRCPADTVGELQRAVLRGSAPGGGPGVDCAVCNNTSARPTACTVEEIGAVNGTAPAAVGMAVRKRGRTTCLTYGTIDSIDLSARVPYGDGLGSVILTHQISILPDPAHNASFGTHGDSGSVVVDDKGKVVGLYFAGSDDDGSGVANPIQAVLDALNVDLCTKRIDKKVETKLEKLELKEFKTEIKEFKDKWEHKEWKERDKWWMKDIKEIDKFKDLVDGPGIPTAPVLPEQPAMPGAPGGIEERIAALEAALGLKAGAAPGAPPCIDFSAYKPMVTPNPWTIGTATFLALDHQLNPWPNPGIKTVATFTGLDCGFQMQIALSSPSTAVAASLVHFARAARMEAYNRDGTLAGSAAMSGPEKVAETLTITGAAIDKVLIYAPQNETLLLRFCYEGKNLLMEKTEKVEFKELKDKREAKETKDTKPEGKELKDRIKDIKEPKEIKDQVKDTKEPKEIKDQVKDIKEPKEIYEGGLKEWAEGGYPPEMPGMPGGVEQRLAQLEAAVAQMAHFVSVELRPDLSTGALKGEPDYTGGRKRSGQ